MTWTGFFLLLLIWLVGTALLALFIHWDYNSTDSVEARERGERIRDMLAKYR